MGAGLSLLLDRDLLLVRRIRKDPPNHLTANSIVMDTYRKGQPK